MSQSPFKFLDSYTKEDRDIFFGNPSEKKEFAAVIKTLAESDLQCRFMFVLREEYLAGVTEFEKVFPTFLANRVRCRS